MMPMRYFKLLSQAVPGSQHNVDIWSVCIALYWTLKRGAEITIKYPNHQIWTAWVTLFTCQRQSRERYAYDAGGIATDFLHAGWRNSRLKFGNIFHFFNNRFDITRTIVNKLVICGYPLYAVYERKVPITVKSLHFHISTDGMDNDVVGYRNELRFRELKKWAATFDGDARSAVNQ